MGRMSSVIPYAYHVPFQVQQLKIRAAEALRGPVSPAWLCSDAFVLRKFFRDTKKRLKTWIFTIANHHSTTIVQEHYLFFQPNNKPKNRSKWPASSDLNIHPKREVDPQNISMFFFCRTSASGRLMNFNPQKMH